MPKKNFRSLFRGSKIRLSFLFRLAKIYILHQVGIDSSKGTLQKGKDADILIIDKDISIRCVFSCGRIVEGMNTLVHWDASAAVLPRAGGIFSALMQKRKPRGTCDAAGLLLRRRLPTLPLAQYHRRDEA